ncbi:MAG: RNA-binding protein [Candidatus Margulisiibacteriota bacterium]
MKSIFVGNLPWTASNEELEQKFAEFGEVKSARIIMDKMTGKSKGFGFVDMDDEAAAKAIAAISGSKWGEREITCNEARPREERSDNRRDSGRNRF